MSLKWEEEYEANRSRDEREESKQTKKQRKAQELKLWLVVSTVALGILVSVIIIAATVPSTASLGFLYAIIDVWLVVCWILFTIRAGFRGAFDE